MRHKTTTPSVLAVISIFLFIQSCGPSADEMRQHDQALIDSAKSAAEQDMTAKQQFLDAQKKQQLAQKKRDNDKSIVNYALIRLGTQLQVEETKLQEIQQFHPLRLPAQKQQQINQESAVINTIKIRIQTLNDVLQQIENGADYTIPSWQNGQ
jgi:hypothetical protein